MKFIKQYRLVILIFSLVILLILLRSFNHNIFRYDAVKWAEQSVLRSNILTEAQAGSIKGDKLFIALGNEVTVSKQFLDITLRIDPESILKKGNLAILRRNKGPVILVCDQSTVSAKVWMVLSEMGLKNIYIILPQENHLNR
jgi:rhodanese-related sulfurtransferase